MLLLLLSLVTVLTNDLVCHERKCLIVVILDFTHDVLLNDVLLTVVSMLHSVFVLSYSDLWVV